MSTNTNVNNPWDQVRSQKSFWLLPIIASLFIVGSFLVVMLPQIQAISDGRRELQKQKEQLERLTVKRQFLEGLSGPTLDDQYVVASRVLPNEKPVFQSVQMLMERTKSAAVTLANYDLSPGDIGSNSAEPNQPKTDAAGMLAILPVDFNVSGSFDNIYSLLTAFEVTAPLSQVVAFDLRGFNDQAKSTTAEIGAQLSARVYFAPPPKVLGKASDSLKPLSQVQLDTLTKLQEYQEAAMDTVAVPSGMDEQKANPFSY